MIDLNKVKYNEAGLVPVIAQDVVTNEVLMLAYMNKNTLRKTIETKQATYYSRSRDEEWVKGATSGHYQEVVSLALDCDFDTVLMKVIQTGVACHTGEKTCFFNEVLEDKSFGLNTLVDLIKERKEYPVEGSYTNYLFEKGVNKILKKVGEEAAEIIIGTLNEDKENVIYEIADLTYHMLVLMVNEEIEVDDIVLELKRRFQK